MSALAAAAQGHDGSTPLQAWHGLLFLALCVHEAYKGYLGWDLRGPMGLGIEALRAISLQFGATLFQQWATL